MKKLGFGLMRLPLLDNDDKKSIDIEQSKTMADMFIERGFTYFDTGWMYHDFMSEKATKKFLVTCHERSEYTLATKLHADFFDSKEEIENIFNTQLENTGAGYFDYYLLHDMNTLYYEKYTKFDCWNWMQEKKAAGLVKHIGFSFHEGPELLERILSEHPEVEFVQLQLNYLDWESEGIQSRACYEVARKYNKDIMVMEPVKGGILAMLPAPADKLLKEAHPDWSQAQWAIKFVAGLPGVKVVLSGMSDIAQLDDNTSFMADFTPLTEDEIKLLESCVDIINSDLKIACTGCSYCTDGCPVNMPIPKYFSLYNAAFKEKYQDEWNSARGYYAHISDYMSKASACLKCGQCELICPQHLPVMQYLEDVAEHFEK